MCLSGRQSTVRFTFGHADSSDPVDLPAGSYTGGVTNLTAKAADEAAAELPAVAFT